MKSNDIQKTFYDTFIFISSYSECFTKKYTKKNKLVIDQNNIGYIKDVYKNFNISKYITFDSFKKRCIDYSIMFKEDIFLSAINISDILKKNNNK